MISSKSKSGLSEASHNKPTPATPRVSKLGRGVTKSDADSSSPHHNSRLSIDRSPRSIESKPVIDRKSPRVSTPDRQQPRTSKISELQTQLNQVQDDLKKSKERLASIEKEKEKALEELKEAKKLTDEANEKLGEALVAQKRAEDSSEIEKFRAVELEQSGIEASQKKEEEWQKEIEAVRNQHALDVAALLSTTQELQRVKHELSTTSDAKNQALSHADNATKIAEIHAKKVELISAELDRVKSLLDSKVEAEANETTELVEKLNFEVNCLKHEVEKAEAEVEKAKAAEATLVEAEKMVDQLKIERDIAKKAETDACSLVEEWQIKARELESKIDEAHQLERSASESLASLMKQLEEKSGLLQDAESEVASLESKLEYLEMSVDRQRKDLEESEERFDIAKQEASEMTRLVESLSSELETVKEEKAQALNNEKLAASSVQNLLEEKHKLIDELEVLKDEEDKSKKAMESLASALHEVSSEAREAKEMLLSTQTEHENAESQIEDLKLVLKATNEKYESMLDEAKHEINLLTSTTEQSKLEIENSKALWDQKELNLMSSLEKSAEESLALKRERDRLIGLLEEAEEDARVAKKEGVQLQETIQEAESEISALKGVVDEVKIESMELKERLLDKENELQNTTQENMELRMREAIALEKVEELSKLLEEASTKKDIEENGDASDSEKDYDLLPKVVEFSAENGNGREEQKPYVEIPSQQVDQPQEDKDPLKDVLESVESKVKNGGVNLKDEEGDSVEMEPKMWETCKIVEKDLFSEKELEHEPESFEAEVDSKADDESFDQLNGVSSTEIMGNGGNSPTKQQTQKKKKPLLHKFGSLLKKGSTKSK